MKSFAIGTVLIRVLQKNESSQLEVSELEGIGSGLYSGLQAGEGHSPSQEAGRYQKGIPRGH